MTTTRFSASSTATAATSLTVALGGTPAVGDLVVVFLSTDSEIVTHQPGWANAVANNPSTQFWQLANYRCKNSSGNTLTAWCHTWNASDSGSTVTFTFTAAPTLGVGDKDIPSTNAMAVAVVLAGQTQYLETGNLGPLQPQSSLGLPGLKKPANLLLYAAYSPDTTVSAPDSLVQAVSLGSQRLSVWSKASPSNLYGPTITTGRDTDLATVEVTFSDTLTNYVYQAPYLEEGPMADNRLMFRFKLNRHYTVLNNSGTFTAARYQSTDQINAATQVFVNDQVITSTDRTNILNSGVGGEFRAVS